MNRGFVIVAQNTDSTDYVHCATVLARSIKRVMPDERVSLITDVLPTPEISVHYDSVITFPYGDVCKNSKWKLDNDWQVYIASPYEYTIKLEADMYIGRSISHWWETLTQHDLVLCNTIRDLYGNISGCRTYRKIIDDNHLPDIYNAVTYFRKSLVALKFYGIVRDIFTNWPQYRKTLLCDDSEVATTDVVYSLAAHILGTHHCVLPHFRQFSMTHMKPHINGGLHYDWTKEFIWEQDDTTLRVHTVPQMYPFHYHIKQFASTIEV